MEKEKLLQKVYRFLSFRDRSEKEIQDYLKRKTDNLEQLNKIINQLKEQGVIDDEKFAKEWVQSRRRKYGLRRIKQELLQKGIDKETINRIINHELRIMGEGEVAQKALEKKIKIWKNLDQIEFKKKAINFLMRKGFEYETVQKILKDFLKHE